MRTTSVLLMLGAILALDVVSALQLGRVISSLTGAKEATSGGEEKQSGPVLPLPALPSLPALPPLQKVETIYATKTLFVQVTKRVTQHPICMTVTGVKPPCLPPHHYHDDHDDDYHHHHHEGREDGGSWEENEGLYIQPTAAVRFHATAAPGSGLEDSYYEREGRSKELEASKETPETERKGRYLEIRTPTPAAPSLPLEADLEEGSVSTEARVFDSLLPKSTVTKLLTKTLWVTKVEKVIDHRVTATVEVKNCVPTDSKIQFCEKEHHPNHYYHDEHHDNHHDEHHSDSHYPHHDKPYEHNHDSHNNHDDNHHDTHKPGHYDHHESHHGGSDVHKPVLHDDVSYEHEHHYNNEHHYDDEHHYKEGEAALAKHPYGHNKKPAYHNKPTTSTTTTTTTTTTHKPPHAYKPVHEYTEEHIPEHVHKPEHSSEYEHEYAHKPDHSSEHVHKPEHSSEYAHEYAHKPDHSSEHVNKPEHSSEQVHKPEHGTQKPVQVHWRGNKYD